MNVLFFQRQHAGQKQQICFRYQQKPVHRTRVKRGQYGSQSSVFRRRRRTCRIPGDRGQRAQQKGQASSDHSAVAFATILVLLHAGVHCLPGHLPSNLVSNVFSVLATTATTHTHSFVIIIPAVGQRIVDQTDLPVHAAEILDPTPESVTFTLHTSLAVPKLRIHIDPLTLTLFNRDVTPMQPYLKVPLPSYNLKGTTSISVTRNDSQILDESQLVTALTRAVYQRRFVLSAKGSTMGHLGALNAHLKLDKDVELNGMLAPFLSWH